MTPDERKEIARVIAATAVYYGRQMSQDVLSMMLDDLEDLKAFEVKRAYGEYRRNPKNRQMPLPAQIREMLEPQIDPDSAAREIAARITAAIPKFGWCNGADARVYMGEVGWSVIERQGGWSYVCQHHGLDLDPSSFQAQVRELAKSTLVHNPEAMATAIGLAPSAKTGELQSAGEVLRLIRSPEEGA
jgi:hypothetical protein